MPGAHDNDMITSRDIIIKTGISRATLNNYIRMGILPKPVVRKAGSELVGTKKIGYFPASVLERIRTVRQLKRRGETMESISRHFQENDPQVISEKTAAVRPQISLPFIEKAFSTPVQRISSANVTLTYSNSENPAYLINDRSEIQWINRPAFELFFSFFPEADGLRNRSIFNLFGDWQFQRHLRNWQEIVAVHLGVLRSRIPSEVFQSLSEHGSEGLHVLSSLAGVDDLTRFLGPGLPLALLAADGSRHFFLLQVLDCNEGTLFLYLPSNPQQNQVARSLVDCQKSTNALLSHKLPALISLSVLVVTLQDAAKIRAELPAEDYFDLINRLWSFLGPDFERFGAVGGSHPPDQGLVHYFLQAEGDAYLLDAINCALAIRERMEEFSRNWKERMGRQSGLQLNIGIDEGQDYFGPIYTSTHISYASLENTVPNALRLSEFAHSGSIWTTKNVIGKLSVENREKIYYGVRRNSEKYDTILDKSFTRIIDILDENGMLDSGFAGIASLPITQILGRII